MMSINRYGLDVSYFRKTIDRELSGDLSNFRPDELARVCARLANTADRKVLQESEFNDSATKLQQVERERDSTQARLDEAESKLNKALDAMDYLHSTCCSLITNATDCVSHFEVSGNSMNALDDVVKSEEVQRILNIRLLDLKAGQPKHR